MAIPDPTPIGFHRIVSLTLNDVNILVIEALQARGVIRPGQIYHVNINGGYVMEQGGGPGVSLLVRHVGDDAPLLGPADN